MKQINLIGGIFLEIISFHTCDIVKTTSWLIYEVYTLVPAFVEKEIIYIDVIYHAIYFLTYDLLKAHQH